MGESCASPVEPRRSGIRLHSRQPVRRRRRWRTTTFDGWPVEAPALLAEIAADNRAERWPALRERHAALVRGPTLALAAELAAEFGPVRVFRPHVTRRFRPDAPPLRTDTGGVATVAGRLRAGGRVVGCRAHRHGGALAVRPRPAESLPGGGRRRRVGRGAGRPACAAGRGRVVRLTRRASCAPHRGAGGRTTRGSRWPGVVGCRWCAGGSSARGCRRPSRWSGSARPGGRLRRWWGGWTPTSARPRPTRRVGARVRPRMPLLGRRPSGQAASGTTAPLGVGHADSGHGVVSAVPARLARRSRRSRDRRGRRRQRSRQYPVA